MTTCTITTTRGGNGTHGYVAIAKAGNGRALHYTAPIGSPEGAERAAREWAERNGRTVSRATRRGC